MKVIILAGGFGTRLGEYSEAVPKPMVPIGGKPILLHILERYTHYGHNDFYIALGYKAEVIKEYFLTMNILNSDFSLDLSTGQVQTHNSKGLDWKVTLVDTGQDSMTGGRVKRMQPFIGDEPFMLTYGDGLADININNLVSFHQDQGRIVTVTAVRPVARFGELVLKDNSVVSFKEKPQVKSGWINGGFFVCQPEFFNFIAGDHTVLEAEPLEKAASDGELTAYKHDGFWQCMDTKRDRDNLEELYAKNQAPWRV